MAYEIVYKGKDKAERLLKTTELTGYFYINYYEFEGGQFFQLKTFPPGTLSMETMQNELQDMYDENYAEWQYWDACCRQCASIGIYIGYFDEAKDFFVVGDKFYPQRE